MHTATAPTLSLGQRLAAFSHLCKPRVNSLIVFTAMIGMFLGNPGFSAAATLPRRLARHCSGLLRGRRPQLPGRTHHRCQDGAHQLACHGPRRNLAARNHHAGHRPRRHRPVAAPQLHQRPDHVADAGHLRRLHRHLHADPQAGDTDEHRHRRRFRRHAAAARLDGDDRPCRGRTAGPLPDHFPVDPAALLGARLLPARRLRPLRPAHAAGHPWHRLHLPAHPLATR
jgi:hypothetical protein